LSLGLSSGHGLLWHAVLAFIGMKTDHRFPEHPYMQLAALLRQQIECGQITSQLPSITELTMETGLAVGTVRRAIGILVQEHLVQIVPGRGPFVIR
jgi:DNA-binding GntR family transcriptional regulator